ncbi:hypothetical protein HYS91_02650 [Candidatus Daviesbacteria bacterium]|nr:hypothetical protein [Candidatus Daviesbacteria bacterium]
MRDLPKNIQILNISVNMGRIGGWVAQADYQEKIPLIERFFHQTDTYLSDLQSEKVSEKFKSTLNNFKKEYKNLRKQQINGKNRLLWAEKALTWANILQHRAELA